MDTEISNINKNIEMLSARCKGFDGKLLERIGKEIDELNDELVIKSAQAKDYEKAFNPETFEKTKKIINEFEGKLMTLNTNKGIKSSRLKQLEEKDIEGFESIKKDFLKQLKQFEEELGDYKNKLSSNKAQLGTYLEEEKGFESRMSENYKKRDALEESLKKSKLKIEENKIHVKDFEGKINNYKLLMAEINPRLKDWRCECGNTRIWI